MSSIRDVGVQGLVVPDVPLEETEFLRKEALNNSIELVIIFFNDVFLYTQRFSVLSVAAYHKISVKIPICVHILELGEALFLSRGTESVHVFFWLVT